MRAVNLIPSDQRRSGVTVGVGAGRSGGAAYAVLALLLGIAVLAFLYGHARHQVSSRNDEEVSLRARAQSLKGQASSLSSYTSFIQLRESRTQAVLSLVDSRFDWAHAFHEFGRVLPRDISISSLDGTIAAAAAPATPAPAPTTAPAGSASSASPSSASPSGSTPAAGAPTSATASTASTASSATPPGSVPTFTIAGCATSQRAVATMLQRLRLIDGVSEVTLQSSTKGGSGSSGGGVAGGCAAKQPAFAATVTFQALPSESEAATAATGKSSPALASGATATPAPAPATGGAQ